MKEEGAAIMEKMFSFKFRQSKVFIVCWLVLGIFTIASISTVLVLASQEGTKGNLSKEELKEKVLEKTKGLVKNVNDADEAPEQETENDKVFFLKNSKGIKIGWAHINKKTGEVTGIYNSSIKPSSKVEIDLLKARAKAEDFLKCQGIDVEALILDKAELQVATETGFPDNPTKQYMYFLEFYPQVNGIPVDDFAYGMGSLSIRLSAEDGNINEYIGKILPVPLPEPSSDFKIDESEAKKIAIDMAKEKKQKVNNPYNGKEITYSVNDDKVEKRYMLVPGNILKPCWRLSVEGNSIDANGSLMYINAENGELLLEAQYK